MSDVVKLGDEVHIPATLVTITKPDGNVETRRGQPYATPEEAAMAASILCHGQPVGTVVKIQLFMVSMTVTGCEESGPPIILTREKHGGTMEGREA